MKFVTFYENNEWEGETWRFYLQLEGNEIALAKLKQLFQDFLWVDYDSKDDEYWIDMKPLSEKVVNSRVKGSDAGYLSAHNKCVGLIDTTRLENITEEALAELLYKGGIRNLLTGGASVV